RSHITLRGHCPGARGWPRRRLHIESLHREELPDPPVVLVPRHDRPLPHWQLCPPICLGSVDEGAVEIPPLIARRQSGHRRTEGHVLLAPLPPKGVLGPRLEPGEELGQG